jgi:hypothetical protein
MVTNTVKIEFDNSFGPHMIVRLMTSGVDVGTGIFTMNEPDRLNQFITSFLITGKMNFI